jgi:hypothetical protein
LEGKLSDLNAELITWVDPYVLDRPWNTDEEIEQNLKPVHCHTVGYVALETNQEVVLAQGYQGEGEVVEWGHCWVIPKICILKRQALQTEMAAWI